MFEPNIELEVTPSTPPHKVIGGVDNVVVTDSLPTPPLSEDSKSTDHSALLKVPSTAPSITTQPKRVLASPTLCTKNNTEPPTPRGLATITCWPELPQSKTSGLRRLSRLTDEYGFYKTPHLSSPVKSPVCAVAERKLMAGVITQEEHDHIIRIMTPSVDTNHVTATGHLREDIHLAAWTSLILNLDPTPVDVVDIKFVLSPMPSPPRRPRNKHKLVISPLKAWPSPRRQFLCPADEMPAPAVEGLDRVVVEVPHPAPMRRSASMPVFSTHSSLTLQSTSTPCLFKPTFTDQRNLFRRSTRPGHRRNQSLPAEALQVLQFRLPVLDFTSSQKKSVTRNVTLKTKEYQITRFGSDSNAAPLNLGSNNTSPHRTNRGVHESENTEETHVHVEQQQHQHHQQQQQRQQQQSQHPHQHHQQQQQQQSDHRNVHEQHHISEHSVSPSSSSLSSFTSLDSDCEVDKCSNRDHSCTTPPLLRPAAMAKKKVNQSSLRNNSPDTKTTFDVMLAYHFPVDDERVHKLIDGGVPPYYRSFVWHHLIDGYVHDERESLGPGYYQALSNVHASMNKKVQRAIELDLTRTFPENKHFNKQDGEAVQRLRRVLTAFTRRNPSIGYCQGFNFIAAFALLILPEESAFWCLVAIIEHIMPPGYFSGSLSSARADQQVLRRAVERWCPKISAVMRHYDFDLSVVTFSWFMTLFVDDMPHQITLRIWDQLLFRGSIVLFQSTFAFLKMIEAKVLSSTSRLEIFSVMLSLSSQVDDVHTLMEIATTCPIEWQFVNHHRKMCSTPTAKQLSAKRHQGRFDEAIGNEDVLDLVQAKLVFDAPHNPQTISAQYWWEALCISQETMSLFRETASICCAYASMRGITYLKLKRELLNVFDEEVIDRNKVTLQTILKAHESRVQALPLTADAKAYGFNDVVMYPALKKMNGLEDLPFAYTALAQQAIFNTDRGNPPPPSPAELPATILNAVEVGVDTCRLHTGVVSEQIIRNRTAELCLSETGSTGLHYMTIKRKLVAEFGSVAFEKHKRIVQTAFRGRAGGLQGLSMSVDQSCTGQRLRSIQFDADHYDFMTTVVCTLFVPGENTNADDNANTNENVNADTNENANANANANAEGKGAVWCGTSDGSLEILSELRLRTNLKRHSSSTTCLTLQGKHVWSGSEDGTICVTDSTDNRLLATLYEATGAITCLRRCNNMLMWCGTVAGQILQYNTSDFSLQRAITLPVPEGSFYLHTLPHAPTLTGMYELAIEPDIMDLLNGRKTMPHRRFVPMSILMLADCIWIGTGRHLIILKKETKNEAPPPTPNSPVPEAAITLRDGLLMSTGEDQVTLECCSSLCLTSPRAGEVWSCSHCDPYMIVWNDTGGHPIPKTKFPIPWGDRGVYNLFTQSTCVWGGCRDGSVIVWNSKYERMLNLLEPTSPIASMCQRNADEVVGICKQTGYTLFVYQA